MALSDLALVNPSAKYPFDPFEKWLNEPDDVSFYLIDQDAREVGFFSLRVGVGPEVRHLTYVFVKEDVRGDSYRLREKRRSGLLQKTGPAPEPNETANQ